MLGTALRETFREGYDRKKLTTDILAGIVVGIVALPLSLALAIASGVSPERGLYTVVTAGAIVALLGGSRVQVTGPTAAFVVLLLPVVQKYGLSGLLTAGLLAGFLLIALGVMKWGEIIRYVPHPVTTGFTTGIALVIATLQVKDFFGFPMANPSDFMERMQTIALHVPDWNWRETLIAGTTLFLLFNTQRVIPRIPTPIIALAAVTLLELLLERFVPGWSVATIANRFNYTFHGQTLPGVPQMAPSFEIPWMAAGSTQTLSWQYLRELFPSACAIAMLGAIESLLSAVVSDGMIQKRHEPNAELLALGIGNVVAPFFGGIAATGAIARTTTNVRFGGRSPIAAFTHAVVIFTVLLLFAPYVSYMPMAGLAALLIFVAWNMAERHNFLNILKLGTREDKLVLLTCFFLTVIFDMTVGVGVGMGLAAVLFVHRMARLGEGQVLTEFDSADSDETLSIPDDVFYYRVAGALFFGAAQRAFTRLSIPPHKTTVVLDISDVHAMDITGMTALNTVLKEILTQKKRIYLIVRAPNVLQKLDRLETFVKERDKTIFVERSPQPILDRLGRPPPPPAASGH